VGEPNEIEPQEAINLVSREILYSPEVDTVVSSNRLGLGRKTRRAYGDGAISADGPLF